jgi:hypothetical protein
MHIVPMTPAVSNPLMTKAMNRRSKRGSHAPICRIAVLPAY